MENNNDTHRIKRSSSAWLGEMREFLRGRFSLDEDKAQRDEVVASISKGVVFRGVNLWVLIFATMIASLGLNVNSAAVIIGAMLISPIMGPIMGIGLSLGINDFELLKKSLRNYALMFVVAIRVSTLRRIKLITAVAWPVWTASKTAARGPSPIRCGGGNRTRLPRRRDRRPTPQRRLPTLRAAGSSAWRASWRRRGRIALRP